MEVSGWVSCVRFAALSVRETVGRLSTTPIAWIKSTTIPKMCQTFFSTVHDHRTKAPITLFVHCLTREHTGQRACTRITLHSPYSTMEVTGQTVFVAAELASAKNLSSKAQRIISTATRTSFLQHASQPQTQVKETGISICNQPAHK